MNLNEWIDLAPELRRQTASQLQQADSTLLGTVTELVDATNVAVAIDGVGDTQADVVCPGSGRMWVGARVRCIRDSSGRVVRVEALAVDELPEGVETQDMDATTQWMASEQSATAEALDSARVELSAAMERLNDPDTGLDATQQKADDAAIAAANAALAAVPPFVQQATPSATVVGQLWFPTDSSGRVIGMKVSTATGTGSWQDYLMMAGQILVPGSVGTTEIGPEGVTAANIKASNELWAKIATFAKVTTDMLTAGNAVITGDLLADIITGIILRGGLFEAGGGALPMIRVGPLSGQIGTGDTYGVQITTPNSNANGSATLAVSPTGASLTFNDGSGNEAFYVDGSGSIRIRNLTDGGTVDLATIATRRWSWDRGSNIVTVDFNSQRGWSQWAFFDAPYNTSKISAIGPVSSPTGRFSIEAGWELIDSTDYDYCSLQVQWGFYTANPNNFGRTDILNSLYGAMGRAMAAGPAINGVRSGYGAEMFTAQPNTNYWIRPFYKQNVMDSPKTARIQRFWMSTTPA